VIDNSGSLEQTREQVRKLWQGLRPLATMPLAAAPKE
jgi:dephospho-CoA kinase